MAQSSVSAGSVHTSGNRGGGRPLHQPPLVLVPLRRNLGPIHTGAFSFLKRPRFFSASVPSLCQENSPHSYPFALTILQISVKVTSGGLTTDPVYTVLALCSFKVLPTISNFAHVCAWQPRAISPGAGGEPALCGGHRQSSPLGQMGGE